MTSFRRVIVAAFFCAVPGLICAQATEASITKQLQGLRGVPDAQRSAATAKIAEDIRSLPPGLPKLKLADGLSHLATEGDPGRETLTAVVQTLAVALAESPQPAKNDVPASPYHDLANIIRYEHITIDSPILTDPMYLKAVAALEANDIDISKADFTLKDLHNKKWTLSELKGKIVLVNFWATWCPPCRKEMPDLDVIYTHFQAQGLVILSLTDENPFKVNSFIGGNYHPPVLLDEGGKVAKELHVEGIPKSFVFDRDGKLVAQSIDMRTQHQFFMMLAQAGLHP